jgi:hypothetical protein
MVVVLPQLTVRILNDPVGTDRKLIMKKYPQEKPPSFCDDEMESSSNSNNGFEGVLQHIREDQTKEPQSHFLLRPTKKSVQFVPHATVYPIRHVNDYEPDEVERIWYNDQEWKEMKLDYHAVVALVADKTITEECGAFRGLEYQTPLGHRLRKRNRSRAIAAVLEEQKVQCHYHQHDHEAVATVYSEYSEPSAEAARRMGMEDEEQAKHVYLEAGSAQALKELHHPKPIIQIPVPVEQKTCLDRLPTSPSPPPPSSTRRIRQAPTIFPSRWRA